MKHCRLYSWMILSALIGSFVITACASDHKKQQEANYKQFLANDSIPDVLKNIVKAVYTNDTSLLANQVSYPLQRPYPLKDIKDKNEFKAYYTVLVDDSLRNVILSSTPSDWQEFGWRGYSLYDGSYVWVADSLYAVNYISKREKVLIDSLTNVEIKSLPSQLGAGWSPVLTLVSNDNSRLYRIDRHPADNTDADFLYRLSIYDFNDSPENLLKMPEKILNGTESVEGSANIISYVFKDKAGNQYVIFPEDVDSAAPMLYLPDGSQEQLDKAYWYELIP